MNQQSSMCLVIIGAGASGREIAWIARETLGTSARLRFAVERQFFMRGQVDGIPVSPLEELVVGRDDKFVIAIGAGADRERIDRICTARGLQAISLIHPKAVLGPGVVLAPGAIVYPGCVLTANVSVGRHSHVNAGTTLNHDVAVGDFATLSPGVHVAGHVAIGKLAFLGIGAIVVNGQAGEPLCIGEDARVLAGACVTGNVEPGACVAGVPAKMRPKS